MLEIMKQYLGISLYDFLNQEEERLEIDYYYSYLLTTDYIPNKIIECQFLNEECKDYSDELRARKYAREKIGELQTERIVFYQ